MAVIRLRCRAHPRIPARPRRHRRLHEDAESRAARWDRALGAGRAGTPSLRRCLGARSTSTVTWREATNPGQVRAQE